MAMPIGLDVDKLQIGTGDVRKDESVLENATVGDNSKVSVENSTDNSQTTNMTVADGGTVNYKQALSADAIHAREEERRKNFEFAKENAKGAVESAKTYYKENLTAGGIIEKNARNFAATMDKITGVNSSPVVKKDFTGGVNLPTPTAENSGSEMSK